MFTICSLYVHYMFTICSLYVHCVRKRFYTHYDPRKTGQNFRTEQTLVSDNSRLNTGKK